MKKFIIIASLFASAACRQATAPTANQTNKSNAAPVNVAASNVNSANAASPVSTANTPDKTKIKNFDGKGTVTRINLELGSVALDHEEIKGLMPAMQGMEFYVSDKKLLDNLKVGDRVDFVLEDNAGAERIVGIKKAK